jgi:tetratricopeptide (TPR) repeat protein/CHAT domain-containing protein
MFAGFRKDIREVKRQFAVILLTCLLLPACVVFASGDPDIKALGQQVIELYKAGKYQDAIPIVEQILAYKERVLGLENPDTATILDLLGQLHSNMGNYAKAEPLYQRALQIREKVLGPEHPNTGASLRSLASLYYQMGNYAKAEPLYQRALQIIEKALGPEHLETGASLDSLASLYYQMGNYAKAEPLYQRALRISEKALGPEHPTMAVSVANLASLYYQMGNYAKAEPLYQRALRISEKALDPEHPAVAVFLNNLALLYDAMGNYAKAEPLYQRALRIREKALGSEHSATADTLNNLAVHYEMMGNYAKVEPLYQRALRIREKALGPEHSDTALTLNNLAIFYYEMGNYAKAEPLYQRALQISEKALGPEHRETAISLVNLASLYCTMGNYAKAEPLFQRALRIYEKVLGPEHSDTAGSLNNLASLYYMMGNYAKAEPLFQRALRVREKVLGSRHPDTAKSLDNLAALELDVGNIPEARSLALRSEETQIKVLANILSFCSEPQRLAYQEMTRPYSLFAAIDGSDSELASACFRYKGVVLDSIIEDRVLAEESDKKEDRDLVETLGVDKQRLGEFLLGTPKAPTGDVAKQTEHLEQEIERIESHLARNVAGLGRPRRALTTTVEEVQAAIPADAALIECLRYQHYLGKTRVEPRYGAIVLLSKGRPRWIPMGRADEIERSIARYRSQVADRKTADATLEETLRGLFDQVWAPVEKALSDETRTVIISPDGQLNFISFATLLTSKDHFLAEDYGIQYVSSGRDLLRDTKLAPNSQLIAFGDPDFNLNAVAANKGKLPTAQQIAFRGKTRQDLERLGLRALPGTKAECALLAEKAKQWKWPCSKFLAADATEAELRKLRSPHILHLATHGFVLDAPKEHQAGPGFASPFEMRKMRYFENPMHRAGLALAGAQTTIDAWRKGEIPPTENDGIVTAEEVSTLNLEGTWLVTLSACNTGLGEAKSGEGVLGLRRGFIQAGAKNLLMTLWPISDATTVDIMAQFYEAAHKTGNAPEALADVQRDCLVKLRKANGLTKAVNLAGPFILSSQGKP